MDCVPNQKTPPSFCSCSLLQYHRCTHPHPPRLVLEILFAFTRLAHESCCIWIFQVYVHSRSSGIGLHDWPAHERFDLPEARAASALALVLKEQMLYVWDAAAGAVGLFKLKQAAVTWHGTLFKLRKGSIAAMAVDYITLNMFWSSSDQPGVYVTSANGIHTALIIDQGMVRSLALHPPTGWLCFSNTELQGTGTRVECTYMDGGNRTIVWDGAVNPVSLSLSNDGTTLYWADTSELSTLVPVKFSQDCVPSSILLLLKWWWCSA